MAHFFAEYGLFLAKVATIVFALIVLIAFMVAQASKGKGGRNTLKVKKVNKTYDKYKEVLSHEVCSKDEVKQIAKAEKKKIKAAKKQTVMRPRLFVLDFYGDIKASATAQLREEITSILTIATPQDEVLVRLESPGGIVPCYGLAASQLMRLRERDIPLIITVDKIAASGGYMMACCATKILAAPYSIIGSIGVVAQLPNFHRLLKKNDIDYEQITAGQYKRTISMFGKNTEAGREKVQEDVNNIHEIFKDFIITNRPCVDIDQVATGEHWHGVQALEHKLVDELVTSDDYLLRSSVDKDIFEVHYACKKTFTDKLSLSLKMLTDSLFSVGKNDWELFH